MWINNKIFRQDLENAMLSQSIDWQEFRNKTFFITGATGLIGYTVVSVLCYASLYHKIPIKILALVRNIKKANERFRPQIEDGAPLIFVQADLEHIPEVNEKIDYIIHGASPTASAYFRNKPIETVLMNLRGSISLLELAYRNNIQSFVFLSSMEVYGEIKDEEKINEKHVANIDTMNPRNSYPEVKRMIESLCASYAFERNINTVSLRLAQTFGPGVRDTDNRVFVQFIRAIESRKDIRLKTSGQSKHSYLYTLDAATAIFTALQKGEKGQVYNVANEATYMSIREMAEFVADLKITKENYSDDIKVIIEENDDISNTIYPTVSFLNLDTKKMNLLGWKAGYGLKDMYERLICTRISK